MITTEFDYSKLLSEIDWDFKGSTSGDIHSIHPYPAKFIPDIPRALLKTLPLPENSLVLDPFCGSGVTLTEAQKIGIESVGIDLNPIACLLSRVKTQELPENFLNVANEIAEECKNFTGAVSNPNIPNVDHWFKKEIQEALSLLVNKINQVTNQQLLDSLRFCFSSIIVRISNQDSDTRYAAVDKTHTKADVFKLFMQSAEKLHNAKRKFSNSCSSTVINKNSLLLTSNDLQKKIGLLITSPPYPNAYEYWLYHKYRMWWLGYDPLNVKEQEIGARAHYFKKNHQTAQDFITQMETLFDFISGNSANGAFIAFIIGRSKIHGKIIENEKIIKETGEASGLQHITTITRTINSTRKSFNLSHARIKEEYIVILQK